MAQLQLVVTPPEAQSRARWAKRCPEWQSQGQKAAGASAAAAV